MMRTNDTKFCIQSIGYFLLWIGLLIATGSMIASVLISVGIYFMAITNLD